MKAVMQTERLINIIARKIPISSCLLFLMGALIVPISSTGAEPSGDGSATTKKNTFWFIPHTHWEGAVFKTREEYLDMGLSNISRALRMLESYPNYKFVLDQACYVKPFLERYPEEETAFRKYVAEGRLQLVGGTDVMLDVNMPSGESFIRQVLYGKGYFRDKLGVDITVGWLLDTFGHHAQMPQLMKLAGFKSYWFFRGVPKPDTVTEFIWQGLDGSRIPAFWLPHSYAITYNSPKTLPEFTKFFKGRFDMLTPFSRGADRVGLAGADVCLPEEHVPGLVDQFNRANDRPFDIRIGVPTDFEQAVAKRTDLPVIEGELNPIFQGAYSSRIELKQWTRNLERLLTTAEKLGTLVHWTGKPTDDDMVWRAWEPMLFNQTHDLMSGVMTDHVYEDTIHGYQFSKRLVDESVEKRLGDFFANVDTRGDGIPVVVFNSLSWPRTDVAEVDLGFSNGDVHDLAVIGPAGKNVPVQITEAQRYNSGGLVQAKIAFVARDVPALGYGVYHVIPQHTAANSGSTSIEGEGPGYIENEYFRVALDASTGAMTKLLVKSGQWEALAGPGNVVSREADHGDLWELYKPLDASSRIAMKSIQAVPQPGKALFSNDCKGDPGVWQRGPVVSEFNVSHPFGDKGTFATTVRLYAGVRRIDIRTKIRNHEKFVRYQALFPSSIKNGRSVHEIPFGAIQRPIGIEFPAQNWVDYGDGEKGLAVLNRGLPGNLTSDGTMMLSLMRSTRIVAYGFGGGYEPGMTSDTGFELGKELTFDYALVPHAGSWQESGIYRDGLEFNNPLIVRKMAPHPGTLPKRWGLLNVSHPNVVVSALKPSRDGSTVLRVYEATGRSSSEIKIKLRASVASAEETNLMEDAGRKLSISDDTLKFGLGPFEIKTFKLRLRTLKKSQ